MDGARGGGDVRGHMSPAAAVSSDELRLYTQGKQSEEPPLMLTRTSKAASFAGAAPLPGITEYVRSPDMSADELTLVGTVRDPAGRWVIGRLVRSRPSEAFSEPQIVVQGAVPEVGLGAPNLAPGCALYYVLHHPVVGYAAYRTRLQ